MSVFPLHPRLLLLCLSLINSVVVTAAEPQRLTVTGRLKFSPVFREKGRELIFVELTDPTVYRLQKLTLANGTIEPLHPEATTSEFEPASAADGGGYAYLQTRGVLSIGITVRDSQGAILGEILPESGLFGYRHPTLAPGLAQVAFAFGERGTQQIYSSQRTGAERRRLTDSAGLNQWPAYSPDGKSLAFGSSRDGNFEIYRMRADGSEPQRLTDHPLQDLRPRWSPDGRHIVFTSHRDGNAEIYVMPAAGGEPRRITQHAERDDYADWHPDGQRLVTVSERQGRHEIWLWDIAAILAESPKR